MSRELFKMNMISSVQKLDNEDIEIIQNYIKTIEQENKQLKERIDKANEILSNILVVKRSDGNYGAVKNTRKKEVYEAICMLNEILETPRRTNYNLLGDKENINNNAEDIEDLDARITRAEEQYDKQKEEMILGEKE